MFKVSQKYIVKGCPVVIRVPQDDGKMMEHEAHVDFEIIGHAEENLIYEARRDSGDVLKRVVVGWSNDSFQTEDGAPLPYNDENKAKLLQIPFVRRAIWFVYFSNFAW